MQEILDIEISDFDYPLDDARIAKYPLTEREQSKLLLYRSGEIKESHFYNLPEELPHGSFLVRNNTKVIQARLLFRKPTGAEIEIFCLDPISPASYELSLSSREGCLWHCMIGNSKRWKEGELTKKLKIADKELELRASRLKGDQVLFSWDDPSFSFGEILSAAGILPIPPYLNRDTEESDKASYQTIYARWEGSVAAPTAGLHFSTTVEEALRERGIPILDVTLHVGAGTFKPVKSKVIGEHVMHAEWISLSREGLVALREEVKKGHKCIAVGTTSTRTLESLMVLAEALHQQPSLRPQELSVSQWEAYEEHRVALSRIESLELLISYLERWQLSHLVFPTNIIIAPGYRFRFVDGLITNFHQPHSTLLLLISAFTKGRWREIYDYALAHDFRFLSYGDSSLLLP